MTNFEKYKEDLMKIEKEIKDSQKLLEDSKKKK